MSKFAVMELNSSTNVMMVTLSMETVVVANVSKSQDGSVKD